MKVTFNIDCTPQEARDFLGLPDVAPMQERLMAEAENQLRATMQAMNPESLMKVWLPAGLHNVEQAQKAFWSSVQQTMTGIAGAATDTMHAFNERAANKE